MGSMKFVAAFFCAIAIGQASEAQAELPANKLLTAPAVSPGQATSYYNLQTTEASHTDGAASGIGGEPQIEMLARTLGAGRLLPPVFTQNVFDYVRNNIDVEMRYGLSKGARGALIDQSGTPFDQADLAVKLLRQGGVTADYALGTIQISAEQFGKWTGLVNGLTANTQSFTVDAKAACRLLADGGIPATVNGSSDCEALSGNLPTTGVPISMAHIWVTTPSGSFDPSFKRNIIKAGLNLPAVMQCNASCGAPANSLFTGASSGMIGAAPYWQNLNEVALGGAIKGYATLLQGVVRADKSVPLVEDVVGGNTLDLSYAPTLGLPYGTSGAVTTWTGKIPDAYRTKLRVRFGSVDRLFFADETAGRRLWFFSLDAIYVDNTPITAAGCASCVASTVILDVNHPYASQGGAYADDHFELLMVEDGDGAVISDRGSLPVTIVQGWGNGSAGTEQHFAQLQQQNPVPTNESHVSSTCGGKTADGIYTTTKCRADAQPTLAGKLLNQGAAVDKILAGVSRSVITRHHSVGMLYGRLSNPTSLAFFSVVSDASIAPATVDDTGRTLTFETAAALWATLEGSVGQQTADSVRAVSTGGAFSNYNRTGINARFLNVAPATMASVLPALNYSASQKGRLQGAADAGFTTILANMGGSDSGELFFKQGRVAYSVLEGAKGGGQSWVVDPVKAALDSTRESQEARGRKKYLAVSPADGELTLTPGPDLVTGPGDTLGLSFQRSYRSSGMSEASYMTYTDSYNSGDTDNSSSTASYVRNYSGPDNDTYLRIGGGWTHNFAVTASYGNDGAAALGVSNGLNASSVIAGVLVLRETLRSTTFENRLAAIFTTKWIADRLIYNSVTVKRGNQSEAFFRLPDGSFNSGSAARLKQTGERDQYNDYRLVSLDYTGKTGDEIKFSVGFLPLVPVCCGATVTRSAGTFKADTWTYPNGVVVTFGYERKSLELGYSNSNVVNAQAPFADVLTSVSNSLGRSLTFANAPMTFDGRAGPFAYRLTRVTDDTSRYVDFQLTDCEPGIRLLCKTLTVSDPVDPNIPTSGATKVVKYDYAVDTDSPDPTLPVRPTYRLRRWYTQAYPTTAYQVARYDALGRVEKLTDAKNHATTYYPGAIATSEKWKRAYVVTPETSASTMVFDWKNSMVESVDPLGRTQKTFYDNAGRPTRAVQLGLTGPGKKFIAEEKTYDIRGNVLTVCTIRRDHYPNPCNKSSGDLVITTEYKELDTVWLCTAPKLCNRPNKIVDARDKTTDFVWYDNGDLKDMISPPDVNDVRPKVRFEYEAFAGVSLPKTKTEWVTANDTVVTTYTYDENKKYALKSAVVDSGGKNITSCFGYDSHGNVVSVTDPRAGACP